MSSVGSKYAFSENDVPHLVTCLASMSHKWEQLGIALGLSSAVRDQCRDRNNIIALTNILTEWIVGEGGVKPATLENLQLKIKGPIVGLGKLAQTLIEDFNKARGTPQEPSNGDARGNEPLPTPKKHCTEDDQAELVIPKDLEEENHIEIYKKAAGQIIKSNPDILKKDFPSGEHLCKVAEKIESDWKNKPYLLKLDRSDVYDIIEGRNRDNPEGQRQEALEKWRGRAVPTYNNLLIILIKGNWKDAVDVLVRLCTK